MQPTRLLRPWDFPGKSTGVGCHCLLWTPWLWAGNANITDCPNLKTLSEWSRDINCVVLQEVQETKKEHMKTESKGDKDSRPCAFIWSLIYLLTYLFLAVLGLCCCTQAFSSCSKWGLLSKCMAWASHCSSFSCCRAWALEHKLSCFLTCGIFLDRGLNSRPLH